MRQPFTLSLIIALYLTSISSHEAVAAPGEPIRGFDTIEIPCNSQRTILLTVIATGKGATGPLADADCWRNYKEKLNTLTSRIKCSLNDDSSCQGECIPSVTGSIFISEYLWKTESADGQISPRSVTEPWLNKETNMTEIKCGHKLSVPAQCTAQRIEQRQCTRDSTTTMEEPLLTDSK